MWQLDPPCLARAQRVPRRGAVRAGADLADRAGHLRADRPGVVLHHRRRPPPANFVGRVGAFLAELSFQLFGYGAYLIPAVIGDRRLALLLVPATRRDLHQGRSASCCSSPAQRVPQPRVRQHRCRGQDLRRRRVGRRTGSAACSPEYLNRTGSIIVHAHADDAVGDPVDAVLVRPDVRRRPRRWSRTCRRAALGSFRGWLDERRAEQGAAAK